MSFFPGTGRHPLTQNAQPLDPEDRGPHRPITVFDYPTIERRMVNLDAALFHHFLELSIADWIGHIPADAPEDHVTFKMAALELDHRAVPLEPFPAIILKASAKKNLRQNPRARQAT